MYAESSLLPVFAVQVCVGLLVALVVLFPDQLRRR